MLKTQAIHWLLTKRCESPQLVLNWGLLNILSKEKVNEDKCVSSYWSHKERNVSPSEENWQDAADWRRSSEWILLFYKRSSRQGHLWEISSSRWEWLNQTASVKVGTDFPSSSSEQCREIWGRDPKTWQYLQPKRLGDIAFLKTDITWRLTAFSIIVNM